MKTWVGNWLMVLVLVFLMFSNPSACDPPAFKLGLVDALLGVGSTGPSITSQEDVSGAILFGSHSVLMLPNLHGRRMRFAPELSQQSGAKDARWVSSRRSDSLPESKHRAETVASRRNSRALLQQSSNASCPVDFEFIKQFPVYDQACQNFNNPQVNTSLYCTDFLSAIGQAESEYLRVSGNFRFQDEATVAACMTNLSNSLSLDDNCMNGATIVSTCFPQSEHPRLVSHPSNCQGIMTRADFERLVGLSVINSTLNRDCNGNILDINLCRLCVNDMEAIIASLSAISPNKTDCEYYTLFYAAGISNLNGPYATGTANCILAVTVNPSQSGKSTLALHIGIGAAAAFAASVVVFALIFLWWKRRQGAARREFLERNSQLLKPVMRPNTGLIKYSFEEIKAATKGFSSKSYIGSGGFGDVYRGVLDDGLEVAIKRMKNCSPEVDADFLNEVTVINSVRHRNLVILRGCCVASTEADGHQRLLVYDYVPNGSLQDYLFGKDASSKPLLDWSDRKRLAIGMAKGIVYLHNETQPPIIHRDIKASNLLLDEKLDAKVADFGLAKFSIDVEPEQSNAVVGTLGYVAPEYATYGQLTEKNDVYSFGVVLLELMSGKSAIDGVRGESALITDWAWDKVNDGRSIEAVDERIRNRGPRDVMESFVLVGILCSHVMVVIRPAMQEVFRYLEGDSPVPHILNRPHPINMLLDDPPAPVYQPRSTCWSENFNIHYNIATPTRIVNHHLHPHFPHVSVKKELFGYQCSYWFM